VISLFRPLVRSSAFLAKEIFAVLRQPRLILTLALGPFLILLAFGLGFRNTPRPFRTLFVTTDSAVVQQQIQEFATTMGPQLLFMGVTTNEAIARDSLRRGRVDLVVLVPPNPEVAVRNNEQAVFTLLHNEIDPLQANYVEYFGQLYVAEVNRRILQRITQQGQNEASAVHDEVMAARDSATGVRDALARGDTEAAKQHQKELDEHLRSVELSVGTSVAVIRSVQQTLGQPTEQADDSQAVLDKLNAIRDVTNALDQALRSGDTAQQGQNAESVGAQLADLDATLTEFRQIQPAVIVSPFRSEAKSIAGIALGVTSFFAPAVLALLLQHVAITFGALSIVGERLTGTVELFRVSPISPAEVLIGKYASYMIFGGILATVLTLLIRYALGVPMLGNWLYYIAVVALVLFASLGIGFVISMLSHTDSQAVQLAMLVLLASVFFSGFFMALYLFWPAVQVISWMLPVTYGIQLLQNIMLRGAEPNLTYLGGLLVIGLVLFIVAWFQMNSLMARR
jgi:ABC-2 type transport system permease protein